MIEHKYIPGYEGLYSAYKDGRIYSHITTKFLKPRKVSFVWYRIERECKKALC